MSYRKVGGLHFIKVGRFGCSFYVSKATPKRETFDAELGTSNALLALLAVALFFGL